jgi:hypothetical protein
METEKLTYDQRVHKMAKMLASENEPYAYSQFIKKGKTPAFYMKWGSCITRHLVSAKISVESQVEAIREYLLKSWGDYAPTPDKYLIENGYMPAPEVNHSPKEPVKEETEGIACVFCGITPIVFKGTCCATCGKSYRHG